jgi:hypothetical protein
MLAIQPQLYQRSCAYKLDDPSHEILCLLFAEPDRDGTEYPQRHEAQQREVPFKSRTTSKLQQGAPQRELATVAILASRYQHSVRQFQ